MAAEEALNRSPDGEFVERLRALESDAWTELYDRHHEQLWRYAYARTASRDLADELVQQAFAEAVASIRRYRVAGKPILAWLYIIVRNHASKAMRDRRRQTPMPDALAVRPLDAHLELAALAEALAALPGPQREVLVLRFFAGYAPAEVASLTGKTVTAVYSLQARALERMRRLLESETSLHTGDEFLPRGV